MRIEIYLGLFTAFSLALPSAGYAAKELEELKISTSGDAIAFDKTELKAEAGKPVHLVFKNSASPGSGMLHSWVLVQPKTESKVAAEGTKAGVQKDYIPDSPHIIAHTRLLKPGESQVLNFKAPEKPGKYPYICTFPGHAAAMKGTLVVS